MKGSIKLFIIFAVLISILLASAGVLFFAEKEYTKGNSQISQNVIVKVEKGKSSQDLANILYEKNLIKNKNLYIYATKIFNKRIKVGFYEIPANASISDIINIIDSGNTKVTKVTIPEGWRVEQIGVKLAANKIVDYSDFMSLASSYEGKLFPDTYFFEPEMTAEAIIKMMFDDFTHRTENLELSNSDLIIASIVEREAGNDTDRALIAGIYKNRVKIGMKLQSDPTVEYGRDTNNLAKISPENQKEYAFWKSAKTSEFTSVISDYNTYRVKGLPAGPICNPGIASIEATLSPKASEYYFFLYGEDGKIYPARNQAEHERNIANYM
jgi:UPF0755 protein